MGDMVRNRFIIGNVGSESPHVQTNRTAMWIDMAES